MSSLSASPDTQMRTRAPRPHFDPEQPFRGQTPTTPVSLWRNLRCVRRLITVVVWSILGCLIQIPLMKLPGQAYRRFPLFYWRTTARIMGMDIRVLGQMAGQLAPRADGKRVVFVANHTSWLDILSLGGTLPAFYIAKDDVRRWPFIGLISKLGSTIYITRNRQEAGQNVHDILQRLKEGHNIAFFPEGTTSDGASVRPFLSSLFAIAKPLRNRREQAEDPSPPLLVQPVSVTYDRLEGLPVGRARRASVFSWFGDMYLMPHVWSLGKWRSMRATILFHEPLDPDDFPTRKALSNAAYERIRQGNEDLRQNRMNTP